MCPYRLFWPMTLPSSLDRTKCRNCHPKSPLEGDKAPTPSWRAFSLPRVVEGFKEVFKPHMQGICMSKSALVAMCFSERPQSYSQDSKMAISGFLSLFWNYRGRPSKEKEKHPIWKQYHLCQLFRSPWAATGPRKQLLSYGTSCVSLRSCSSQNADLCVVQTCIIHTLLITN